MLTATALDPTVEASSYLMGGALLALLLAFAMRASGGRDGQRVARLAAAGVTALYLIRVTEGVGFVPGLIAAAPIAAVGLALGWRRRGRDDVRSIDGTRVVLAVALFALPLVWAVQYTGGASAQWAGRYILPSGLLLTVVGITCLPLLSKWARTTIVILAASVTCFGVAWLSVRSHDVARASQALATRPEPVLVSRINHLAREGGWYVGERRWLNAKTEADVDDAVRVVSEAGSSSFGLVGFDDESTPLDLPGWDRVATTHLRYFPDAGLVVTTYVRAG